MRGTPAGMTYDVCAMCKGRNLRQKDSLCSSCLKEHKEINNELAMYRKRAAKNSGEAIGRMIYPQPTLPHQKPFDDAARDRFAKAIVDVARMIGSSTTEWVYHDGKRDDLWLFERGQMGTTFSLRMTDAERNILQELYEAIVAGVKAAYGQGVRRGSCILQSLQAGEITGSQFEEKGNR